MTTKQKPAANPAPDPAMSKALATLALRPNANAAAVVAGYGHTFGVGDADLRALVDLLGDDVKDVCAGDMKRAEAMLYGQATALQAIFVSLARRASEQQYLKQWEAYLRMALKAQGQCRATLETLAAIKNPPVVFARQANIAHGPQQVNNGGAAPAAQPAAHAGNEANAPTELLEASRHEQWMDPGAKGATGGADPHLVPVGQVHRPKDR